MAYVLVAPAQYASPLIDSSDVRPPVAPFVELADHLYLVAGGGCNTAVFVTASSVVVVDPKFAESWPALEIEIQRITDRPITHVILTHSHPDHAGALARIPPQVEVVAQEHTVDHLREDGWLYRAQGEAPSVRAYADRLTLFDGDDTVTLIAPGPAHTDGDSLVVFPHARVMHAGDLFPFDAAPTANIETGGDGAHFADALTATATGLQGIDRVITGHGAVVPWSALVDYADFMQFLVRYVQAEMRFGRDKHQVFNTIPLPLRFERYRERLFNTLDEIDRGLRPRWQRVF
jgi:glyoxylase-like metal-dependent hydrolase (beta-lactamase superfamily II)